MKLTVIFSDIYHKWDCAMAGVPASAEVRRVTIDLTEEQKELLKKKTVATVGSKKVFKEEVIFLFLEEGETHNE